ncbi:MAG: ATP-binding cassette domain-containing protein [Patescibacteria group bacterium]
MLRLDGVSLNYGEPAARPALHGVTMAVAAGDRLGLCGPSGAGKSSLLLLAAGLRRPTQGRYTLSPGLRVGLVLQEPEQALFCGTVGEELAFAPRRRGLAPAAAAAAAAGPAAALRLGPLLDEDPLRLPPALQRLVAIAAVLAGEPDLLLLDEPTAGLDARGRADVIAALRAFPGTAVIASHDLDLLWRTARRLILLDRGRLAADTDWESLIARPAPLAGLGLALPEPLQVMAGLLERGWRRIDPGAGEEDLAKAILAAGPRRGGE